MIKMKSLAAALSKLIRLDGEGIKEFAAQIRGLTQADRDWFTERLRVEHNIVIEPETTSVVSSGDVRTVAA